MRLQNNARLRLDELANLRVLSNTGEAIHATDSATNMHEGTSLQDFGDAEIRAIALIGGLILSTMQSLLFVPSGSAS